MPDPLNLTEGPESPSDAAALASAVEPSAEVTTPGGLVSGERWRNLRIGDPVAGAPSGTFHAFDVGSMEEVIIRSFPITEETEARRIIWSKLLELPASRILRPIDAIEEDGRRYEITQAPAAGSTFREWLACHKAGSAEAENLARQLTEFLEKLHSLRVAHLNLRPDSLFVSAQSEGLEILVGGFENATWVAQSNLVPVPVDPYYAPPEAVGLTLHQPGSGLLAWDWWSLGRILQEFVVGKHILAYFLDRDIHPATPELRAKAEALLKEQEPAGVKAGAVEIMPTVEKRLLTLLRGLLASCRDGRWTEQDIYRWLEKKSVKDRYDLAKGERLFIWRNRGLTLPDAAEFFSEKEQWADGEANLYANPKDPTALINFLKDTPSYSGDASRLLSVLSLVDATPWAHIPLAARRTAVAGLAWLTLGDAGSSGSLRIRGQATDWPGLQSLLQNNTAENGPPPLHALAAPCFIEQVESLDSAAARSLRLLATSVGEALTHSAEKAWIAADNLIEQAVVFSLALESSKQLNDRLGALRADYGASSDTLLTGLLKQPNHERWMLVLLAYTGRQPSRYGYITHTELALARYQELHAHGLVLTAAVFWQQVRRVLKLGPLIYGPWWLTSALWAALALAGLLERNIFFVLPLALLTLAGIRLLTWRALAAWMARFDPALAVWTWRDSVPRASAELVKVCGATIDPADRTLARQLAGIAEEIVQLPLKPAPAPLPALPAFRRFWAGVILSYAAAGGLAGHLVIARIQAPPTPPAPAAPAAGHPDGHGETPAEQTPTDAHGQPGPKLPPGLYEEADDGFGRYLRGPLTPWEPPAEHGGGPLVVREERPGRADESAYALVSAEMLLRPFPRKAVTGILAVRVPSASGIAVMLYDAQQRKLADRRVFLLESLADSAGRYQFKGREVIYLGIPDSLHNDVIQGVFRPLPRPPAASGVANPEFFGKVKLLE